jgi:selenocysteine-specific translation elongation factor
MIKNTSLKNFKLIDRNITKITEILEKINPQRDLASPAIVVTDHSFSVKGVGEIILGMVKQGTINKHDTMMLLPGNKEVIIRSIQMQDKDFDNATAGCRVGLAIKGATVEEMKRGTMFSVPDGAKTDKKFILNLTKNRFYPEIKKGVFHATIGMQSIPITIIEITGNTITIETEKPVCYTKNDKFILLDLNAKKLHHMGNGKIV